MIQFANAKINLGLQVLGRRPDGYHDVETVLYPIPLLDVVEVVRAERVGFKPSGLVVPGLPEDNLCLKAYHLFRQEFDLPPVEIYLHKTIPMGAGLGGGSADAAAVLKGLDAEFELGLGADALEGYAAKLGADCAFFVRNRPVFATGIGTELEELDLDLSGWRVLVVHPPVHISTARAYARVGAAGSRGLRQAVMGDPHEWRSGMSNDFEEVFFQEFPELRSLPELLYGLGATYAAMSGSGSAFYGLFSDEIPVEAKQVMWEAHPELSIFSLAL